MKLLTKTVHFQIRRRLFRTFREKIRLINLLKLSIPRHSFPEKIGTRPIAPRVEGQASFFILYLCHPSLECGRRKMEPFSS